MIMIITIITGGNMMDQTDKITTASPARRAAQAPMTRWTGLLFLLLLAAVISACGNNGNSAANGAAAANQPEQTSNTEPSVQPAEPQTLTIKHGYGETEVPLHPERVAVFGLEDVMLSLDAPMVYAFNFDGYYLGEQLNKLGITTSKTADFAPNLEEVLASQPDLIVVQQYSIDETSYEALSKIAPTIAFAPGDWKTSLVEIGKALGLEDKASAVLQAHEDMIKQAKTDIVNAVGPDKTMVYMRPSEKDLQVFFPSFSQLYSILGLNPDASITEFQKKTSDDWGINTSLEELPSITADYIFAIYGGSLDSADDYNKLEAASLGIEQLEVWKSMPAAKQNHVFHVSARHWMSSGPIAESKQIADVVAAVTGKQ
jgi:iron complex transport system substrate-binding protein